MSIAMRLCLHLKDGDLQREKVNIFLKQFNTQMGSKPILQFFKFNAKNNVLWNAIKQSATL